MNLQLPLKAPFPWFGGKLKVAPVIWAALGNVKNYVEPFYGSGAVFLNRPHPHRIATINDRDGYVANFWRALAADPDCVARQAAWPVSENDLHARHYWLIERKGDLVERLEAARIITTRSSPPTGYGESAAHRAGWVRRRA